MRHLSDEEIRDELIDIDRDEDVEVTSWEANFFESILYKYDGPLSPRQREAALRIMERYE